MLYCVKTILCVINLKLCWDVLVQVLKKIGNIQDIDSFERAWKIFDINAIVIQNMNTLSMSITFLIIIYNVNGVSLYNKPFGNQKVSTSYWPSFCIGKYMTYVPS
jgi:hypothetical protein